MAATSLPPKFLIYGENIDIDFKSITNHPIWFLFVVWFGLALCFFSFLAWCICAMCNFKKDTPCRHPVYEARYDNKPAKREVKGTIKSTDKKKIESLNDTELTKSMKSRKSGKSSKKAGEKDNLKEVTDEEKKQSQSPIASGSKEAVGSRSDAGLESVALEMNDDRVAPKNQYLNSNFSYILTDFLVLRLPSTGIITSSCAQSTPGQLLKLPYLIAFISSYLSMLYPCLFCAVRALIVFYPKDHPERCARLIRIAIPATVLLSLCLTVAMVPAVGHCTQLTSPYTFGAIMFTLDMKIPINEYTHFITSFLCTIFTFSINITMLIKVRHILFYKSLFNRNKNYKAELSLTIIMISLLTPFVINGIVVVLSLRDPSLIGYILAVRPIGVDTATVFVPWAFYLTHPMFRKQTHSTVTHPQHVVVLSTNHTSVI